MRAAVAGILAFMLLSVSAPPPAASTEGAPDVVAVARKVMGDARYCALITIGADGRAESRIVDPFPPEETMTVWIATNRLTRKVTQIKKNPHVTLFYWDKSNLAYVTLFGDAVLVDDPAEKAKHWKDEWSAFYSDENRGPDYLLIRVTAKRLEAVSAELPGDPETWRPRHIDFP